MLRAFDVVARFLRRCWYRVIPLSWLKRERMDLLDYKAEVLAPTWSSHRDELADHVTECLDDTRAELERRGNW